ncbi:hypothetical protein LCGC14_1661710 [marine sediment metagenome]|uniref:Uncharacterized protein n=1 Tax=marine sediment metagenome TaxID=412755 RepID=A0A0F9IGB0_9ZZZZ
MKFHIKIYNIEIVDCSSCYNLIFPNPQSREILLEMILRIYESGVISRIGEFTFLFDRIELQSPKVVGESRYKSKDDSSKYKFQSGEKAETNKLSGLYVEQKEDTLKRIKKTSSLRHVQTFYIEPGLNGIKQAIQYIRLLYNNQRDLLPDYLKDVEPHHFRFSGGVIWKMNEEWKIRNGLCDNIDGDDTIGVSSIESDMFFGFGNFGGDSSDIFTSPRYLDHLNAITGVIDEIAPGKFIAGPEELAELLEFEVLKKIGRKLVAGDEEKYKENLERFETYTFARGLDKQSEKFFKNKYQVLKEKAERGEKLTWMENLELTQNEKIVKALENERDS